MTQQNTESVIKLLRLNTGEDIIAHCLLDEEGGCVLVGDPMKVHIRRQAEAGQTLLIMLPWLPIELIEENIATINYEDIITMVDPKKSFIEYYNESVLEYEAILAKRDKDFEEELEDEELDEETLQEMLDVLKEKKKSSVH